MKSKQKRVKAELPLGFVTTRSRDECQAILAREGAANFWPADRYRATVQPNTRLKFLVECPVCFDGLKSWKKRWREQTGTINIQVEGTLTPVGNGTRVVGLITRSTRRAFLNWQFVRLAGISYVMTIFACAVMTTLRFSLQPVSFAMLIVLIAGLMFAMEMLLVEVRERPNDILARLTMKLYLPPD